MRQVCDNWQDQAGFEKTDYGRVSLTKSVTRFLLDTTIQSLDVRLKMRIPFFSEENRDVVSTGKWNGKEVVQYDVLQKRRIIFLVSWINPCCPQVILSSAFSQCCSVSLRCFLTLCVERTLHATRALLMLHSTDVVCTSHHESQAKTVSHLRDSLIMVAEQAQRSERLL